VAVIALHHAPLSLDLFHLMANEIALFGSIADARAAEFGEAIALLATGQQDLSPLISHQIPFSRFTDALALAADPSRAAKVVLTFDEAA
jgi:threonine dehydrogenase-like Zn-dependent dehydrogenase